MRRSVLGLDRILAVLLGLLLLTAGINIAAWYDGNLRRWFPQVPEKLSTDGAGDIIDSSWWPWAAGGAGALAALLGLWWLIAHLPRRGVGMLVLPGSGKAGRLLVDPSGPATTAAEVLTDTPGIRTAHSKVHRDRGQLVIALNATMDPRADLNEVIKATDAVATDLNAVLGRDDAHARVLLTVARRAETQPRVH